MMYQAYELNFMVLKEKRKLMVASSSQNSRH